MASIATGGGTAIMIEGAQGVLISGDAIGTLHGVPVILSHGGGQTRFAWGRTAEMLAAHGFYVLALDLRGHGASGWAGDTGYDIDDYAEDLRRVAATLMQPPILVGASLGGIASLYAAGTPPFLEILGLCLVDVSPHLRGDGVANILEFMQSTSAGFESPQQAADAIAAYLPHRPPPSDLEGLRKNLRHAEDGRYYWHWDPRTIAEPLDPEGMNSRMTQAAAHVHAPTLLLRGEQSELVSTEVAAQFAALFRNGSTLDIPGARHMIAGDRNDLFGRALLDFAVAARRALPIAARG